MAVKLPTYIPLDEAARRYRIDKQVLTHLVESGRIRAVEINGRAAVAEEDVAIQAVQVDESLRGRPIRVTEAAVKYGISQSNLTRWANAGYIRILRRGPKLLELDEADVKAAVEIFRQAQRKTGSSVRAGWVLKRIMTA